MTNDFAVTNIIRLLEEHPDHKMTRMALFQATPYAYPIEYDASGNVLYSTDEVIHRILLNLVSNGLVEEIINTEY